MYKARSARRMKQYKNDPVYREKEKEYQREWRKKQWKTNPEFRDKCYRSTMKYYMKRYNVCENCEEESISGENS